VQGDEPGEVVVHGKNRPERTCALLAGLSITVRLTESDAGDDLGADGVDDVVRVVAKDLLQLGRVARWEVEILALDETRERGVGGTETDVLGTDVGVPEDVVSDVDVGLVFR